MRTTLAYLSASALALAACGNSALTTNDDAGTTTVVDFAGLDLTGVIFDLTNVTSPPDIAIGPIPDLKTTSLGDLPAFLVDIAVKPPVDMTPAGPVDLTANGVTCGNGMTCKVGESCCVTRQGMTTTTSCAASCPDGNFSAACDGPEDCGGNPCCISIMGGAPSGTSCTMAANACQPAFGGFNGMTRACHVDTDCTTGAPNTQLNLCCTATMGGATGHVCLNKMIAGFLGGSCP